MAHCEKVKIGSVKGLCDHDTRSAATHSNDTIDAELSCLNYDLCEREGTPLERLYSRLEELDYVQKRSTNVMCQWVITEPKNISVEEREKFFSSTYEFLKNRYGKNNVVSSYVHLDETTPHMHFKFVPSYERDGIEKLSAKEVINRNELRVFHKDLEKHLKKEFGREVGILNGKTKEGNLTIEELKKNISNKKRKKIDDDIKKIDDIKPERGLFGAVKNISIEDIEFLKNEAKTANLSLLEIEKQKSMNNILNSENKQIKIINANLKNDMKIFLGKIDYLVDYVSSKKYKVYEFIKSIYKSNLLVIGRDEKMLKSYEIKNRDSGKININYHQMIVEPKEYMSSAQIITAIPKDVKIENIIVLQNEVDVYSKDTCIKNIIRTLVDSGYHVFYDISQNDSFYDDLTLDQKIILANECSQILQNEMVVDLEKYIQNSKNYGFEF